MAFIEITVIEEIKKAANVYDTISQFMTLKKVGQGYTGKCPFHDEMSSSFVVSPTKNIFKCFGCGKSGNSITYLMDKQGMTYGQALQWLADKNGITISK